MLRDGSIATNNKPLPSPMKLSANTLAERKLFLLQ